MFTCTACIIAGRTMCLHVQHVLSLAVQCVYMYSMYYRWPYNVFTCTACTITGRTMCLHVRLCVLKCTCTNVCIITGFTMSVHVLSLALDAQCTMMCVHVHVHALALQHVYMYMYVLSLALQHVYMSWVRVPPEAAHFSRKSDCAVLLCLVCLFDLACFFLSSFSSLI